MSKQLLKAFDYVRGYIDYVRGLNGEPATTGSITPAVTSSIGNDLNGNPGLRLTPTVAPVANDRVYMGVTDISYFNNVSVNVSGSDTMELEIYGTNYNTTLNNAPNSFGNSGLTTHQASWVLVDTLTVDATSNIPSDLNNNGMWNATGLQFTHLMLVLKYTAVVNDGRIYRCVITGKGNGG